MGSRRRFTTKVHDEGSRRGFTTKVHDEGSDSDTVRAERAGWLGATSELRDGGSLKTTSERVRSSPAGLRLRRTAYPDAQPIGRGPSDQPCRRRRREHAPRSGRFSAQRSGSPETTGSIGPDGRTIDDRREFTRRFRTRVHTWVHDEGSRRRFTTKVHDEGSRRGFRQRHGLSRGSRLARGNF